MSSKLPNHGDVVTFYDPSGIAVKGEKALCRGTCNGNTHDDDAWVPVWTERDGGREPTTIYVHVANLLSWGAAADVAANEEEDPR